MCIAGSLQPSSPRFSRAGALTTPDPGPGAAPATGAWQFGTRIIRRVH